MQQYKQDFIEFLVKSGILTFGQFTTKSGRLTPYFINTGNYRLGSQLARLGDFYASALAENLGRGFDNLYGPAYKGIPLAVTTAIDLSQRFNHDVSITYNRKEAKDHGEKGTLIGHQYTGCERVVIIEDVITAGTSIRESMDILASCGSPQIVGVIVSVDRRERGSGNLSAIEELGQQFRLPIYPIVNVEEIITTLHNRPLEGKVYLDDAMKQKMLEYLAKYGPQKNMDKEL